MRTHIRGLNYLVIFAWLLYIVIIIDYRPLRDFLIYMLIWHLIFHHILYKLSTLMIYEKSEKLQITKIKPDDGGHDVIIIL